MITAGASAPEELVEACTALLQRKFGATVETHATGRECVRFALPKPLRKQS